MKIFKIKVADTVVKVQSIYDWIFKYCKDYLTEEEDIDFEITITSEDIEFERSRDTLNSKDEYLEILAVHRKISEKMPEYGTVLFHGSLLELDENGYLFTAPSGTGKSTHVRLWREYFGERVTVVNDDKPYLKIVNNQVIGFGTPWDGKHRISKNVAVPLKGICILSQDSSNWIKRINKRESYITIYQQIYEVLGTPENKIKTLQIMDKIMELPIYKMGCTISSEAVEIAYNEMSKEEKDEIKG